MKEMITQEGYDKIRTRARREMMNDWEFGIKRQVRVDTPPDEVLYVRVPGFAGAEPWNNRPDSMLSEGGVSGYSVQSEEGSLALEA